MLTYLAAQTPYRAIPFVAVVRHPGVFGLTITLVSGPTARMLART